MSEKPELHAKKNKINIYTYTEIIVALFENVRSLQNVNSIAILFQRDHPGTLFRMRQGSMGVIEKHYRIVNSL